MQDVLHGIRKPADNRSENKKQIKVVSNEDTNGMGLHDNHCQTEENHSLSVSSAGI